MSYLLELTSNLRHRKAAGRVALLVALLGLCYLLLLGLPTRVYETGDFLGYWAASNLLAHRQSPYDPDALLSLERQQGWQADDPVYSWNPPLLHALLPPLLVGLLWAHIHYAALPGGGMTSKILPGHASEEEQRTPNSREAS